METSTFFTGKSCKAFKINGKGKYVATWNVNRPGIVLISYYDKDGYFDAGNTIEHDLHNNADMFEYLEMHGFIFVE